MAVRHFSKREPLLTVEKLKDSYLFGVDLTDSNGVTISDSAIQSAIDLGISAVENTIQCPITPCEYDERLDYILAEAQKDFYIQLPIYPVTEVKEVALCLGGSSSPDDVLLWDSRWYLLYGQSGQINLIPNYSAINAFVFRNLSLLNPIYSGKKVLPGGLRIKYMAGLSDNSNCVDPVINRCIGLTAAIVIKRELGDIGPGGSAGISSQGISLDGISTNVSTSISATSALYDATISHYIKELEQYTKLLKKMYNRLNFTVA